MRREWNEPRPHLRMQTACDHTIMAAVATIASATFIAGMILGALGMFPG